MPVEPTVGRFSHHKGHGSVVHVIIQSRSVAIPYTIVHGSAAALSTGVAVEGIVDDWAKRLTAELGHPELSDLLLLVLARSHADCKRECQILIGGAGERDANVHGYLVERVTDADHHHIDSVRRLLGLGVAR